MLQVSYNYIYLWSECFYIYFLYNTAKKLYMHIYTSNTDVYVCVCETVEDKLLTFLKSFDKNYY